MNLHEKKCVPCEGGAPPMSEDEINRHMNQIKGWNTNGIKIEKDYKFKTADAAVNFLGEIGKTSNEQGHHPVATWVYNKIKIELWTHAINGLSENDFIMAAKFDKIYEKYKE